MKAKVVPLTWNLPAKTWNSGLKWNGTTTITGTSNNSNGVGNLNLAINNNPPQLFEVQPIADKVDELINALWR